MFFATRYFGLLGYALAAARPPGPPWPEAARQIDILLAEEEGLALPLGFGQSERRQCLFPVLVAIDEIFLASRRPDALEWYPHSLQRRLLSTNQGGELFFIRLESILKERALKLSGPDLAGEAPQGPLPPPGPPPEGGSPAGAERLSRLWISPGQAPPQVEAPLDAYALALILGFRGCYTDLAPDALSALAGRAMSQIGAWQQRDLPPAPARRRELPSLRERLWTFLCQYDWAILHVAIPAIATILIYLKSRWIIESLPF
jgi:type VI protein secretion system component VasF